MPETITNVVVTCLDCKGPVKSVGRGIYACTVCRVTFSWEDFLVSQTRKSVAKVPMVTIDWDTKIPTIASMVPNGISNYLISFCSVVIPNATVIITGVKIHE